MLRPCALFVVVVVLASHAASAEKRAACKTGERAVPAQTPIYGGPGLGFEVVRVVDKDACMRILSTTDDGSFILVELGESKAGWIASGTVDTKLSADATHTIEAPGSFVVVQELALRSEPRFDAPVVGAPLAAKSAVTREAVSDDGQWYLVVVPGEGGARGFVPKYQVASELPAEGSAAAATSTEGWGAARLGRRPANVPGPSTTVAAPAVTDVAAPDATPKPPSDDATDAPKDDPARATDGDVQSDGATTTRTEPLVDGAPDALLTRPPLLGRTPELALTFGYRYFQQSYTSDAQQDPYFKYELSAPLGVGVSLDYGWRGELPLVVDVRAQLGLSGYEMLHTDNVIYTVVGTQLSVWPRVAWRLHENELVDVDAGIAGGFDGLMNYSVLMDTPTSSVLSGFSFGAGPSVAARSRLGDGNFGLLVMEASIPVGGYTMFPDPGAAYTEYAGGRADELGNSGLVYHDAAVASGYDVDTGEIDFNTVTVPRVAGAIPLHLMVGVDGRVRYIYELSSLWRFEVGGSFMARQALIAGPGRRNGSYSEAANIDTVLTLFAGVNFGL